MVLLAGDGDPVIPVADDRLDDADAQSAGIERVALLDMRLEIAEIARRIDQLARPSGKPGLGSASLSGLPSRLLAPCRSRSSLARR